MDCQYCGKPIVIFHEHVDSISHDQWGRLLYKCRILFGTGLRLKLHRHYIKDHWYAHVEMSSIVEGKASRLPDLRSK